MVAEPTSSLTLMLDFQGQILKQPYLKNGSEWKEMDVSR